MRAYMLLLLFATTALADCECGYIVNDTDSDFALFTDLFETDFLHVQDVTFNNSRSIGWIPQNYNTSASSGPYGMAKEDSNLVPNYISDEYDYAGPGVFGTGPGLQLWVRSSLVQAPGDEEALISSAEIVSERDDILYGSFRIAMKTSSIEGTCAAFYSYRNDSQELDVEILSAEQKAEQSTWPIHFVAQNTTVGLKGSSSDRSSQKVWDAPSPPSDDYNEYRFDWLAGRVDWYQNGALVWSTTENVPSSAGRVHISHWSDGNPFWSHGPPTQDAVMTVSYVKAYFNSTNSTRNQDYLSSCSAERSNVLTQTCEIPTQSSTPNPFGASGNNTGHTFFFTQHANMTPGQTVYQPEGSAANPLASIPRLDATVLFLVVIHAMSWVRWYF